MFRLLAVVLVVPAFAFADDADRLRKAMPDDQRAWVEKVEAIEKLEKAWMSEPNAVKKEEMRQKAQADAAAAHKDLKLRLEDKGLTDWVGAFKSVDTGYIDLSASPSLRVEVKAEGLSGDARTAAREMAEGALVKFSVLPTKGGEVSGAFRLTVIVSGKTLKSIEKLK